MNEIPEKVQEVYDIFKNFFGEDYTDLQRPDAGEYYFILVWWPYVTVTNEYDKSIAIKDLYAKIFVTDEGCIPYSSHGFYLNRATYTVAQMDCNYMHSHVCDIPKDDFREFQSSCLGTGPINNTILSLKTDYSEPLWMLFCQELAMYVTVESIAGIPYHRLEEVGLGRKNYDYQVSFGHSYNSIPRYISSVLPSDTLKDFIEYYLTHGHLTFNYQANHYVLGMSQYDYIVDISNAFIDYCNNHITSVDKSTFINRLYNNNILKKVLILNRNIYKLDSITTRNYSRYESLLMCTFKGREIHIHIEDSNQEVAEESILLDATLINILLSRILRTINYRYKNETEVRNQTISTASTTHSRTSYI